MPIIFQVVGGAMRQRSVQLGDYLINMQLPTNVTQQMQTTDDIGRTVTNLFQPARFAQRQAVGGEALERMVAMATARLQDAVQRGVITADHAEEAQRWLRVALARDAQLQPLILARAEPGAQQVAERNLNDRELGLLRPLEQRVQRLQDYVAKNIDPSKVVRADVRNGVLAQVTNVETDITNTLARRGISADLRFELNMLNTSMRGVRTAAERNAWTELVDAVSMIPRQAAGGAGVGAKWWGIVVFTLVAGATTVGVMYGGAKLLGWGRQAPVAAQQTLDATKVQGTNTRKPERGAEVNLYLVATQKDHTVRRLGYSSDVDNGQPVVAIDLSDPANMKVNKDTKEIMKDRTGKPIIDIEKMTPALRLQGRDLTKITEDENFAKEMLELLHTGMENTGSKFQVETAKTFGNFLEQAGKCKAGDSSACSFVAKGFGLKGVTKDNIYTSMAKYLIDVDKIIGYAPEIE